MRAKGLVCASLVGCGLLGPAATRAFAQAPDARAVRQEIDQVRRDFEAVKRQYDDRLAALEARLDALQGAAPPAPALPPPVPTATAPVLPGADGAGGPSGALPVYGSAVTGSKIFNPDIAVIGNFIGAAGRNAVNPEPALAMPESEASFQAVVDPYARADFFLAFGESGVELEEGHITFTSLPGGLLTKVGKMRGAFGKVNALHNHVLPWADRPLVTQNLVGGEDGVSDAGISVARLIPNPWLFLEGTGQVFRGNSGAEENPLFTTSHPGDLAYLGRVRGYHDITEGTNIDLGVSYARGHNGLSNGLSADAATLTTGLFGVDATYRWRPLRRSIYHSFLGRTEWIWSRRNQPNGLQNASGMYASGDYQIARRWFAGARFDRSARADDPSLVDTGQSLIVTYWPSEFSQVRGQFRRTNHAAGQVANELLFQFQFSIGAHGGHPF